MLWTEIRDKLSTIDKHVALGEYHTAASILQQLSICRQETVAEALRSDKIGDFSLHGNDTDADIAHRRQIVVGKLHASALRSSRSIERVRKCIASTIHAGGIRCYLDASELLIECYTSRIQMALKRAGAYAKQQAPR